MLYRPGLVGRVPCPMEWYFGSGPPAISDDFSSGLPAGWTFSRAGNNATNCLYSDSPTAPAFTTYIASTPRFLDFGLLMEPARTNSFLNSDAPVTQGANVAVGIQYTLWMHGTGSVTISGPNGPTGTATHGVPFVFTASGTGTQTITVTAPATRVQFEMGASPTSYIVSGATAQSRAADLLSKNYLTGPLNLSQGTYWVEYMWATPNDLYPPSVPGVARIMTAGAGSFTSNVSTDQIVASSAGPTNRITGNTYNAAGTNATGAFVPPPKPTGNVSRVAMSVDANSAQIAQDYVLGTRVSNAFNYRPNLLLVITLGCGGTTPQAFNGYIRGFRYWPVAMPDAELKECTGPGYYSGPPVFNLDLRTQLPRIMTFARAASTAVCTDGRWTDAPGSSYNTFGAPPAPRYDANGLIMEVGRNNYYPLGAAPITRTSLSLGANQGYKLWIIGTGSVTVSPGTTTPDVAGNGAVATQGNPAFVQCTVAGTVTLTVTGSVNRAQMEQVGNLASAFVPTTFMQNTTALQSRGGENLNMVPGNWWSAQARTYYIEMWIAGMTNTCTLMSCGSADGTEREQIFYGWQTNNDPNSLSNVQCENIWPANFEPSCSFIGGVPANGFAKVFKFAYATRQGSRRAFAMNGQLSANNSNDLQKPFPVRLVLNTALQSITSGYASQSWRRFSFWDYDLTDAQLVAMTT